MDVPSDRLEGSFVDHVRGWPSVCAKVSPQMKAHIIAALHQEGFTRSLSEYIRVIVANHIAEILDLSVPEIMHGQPKTGSSAGRRYLRIK